ncbi:MAG: XRE family transcriptional regulator [Flavobacteriales bacterium]|nr:XRE family transcriptional regulator [Flavobacteriales bacterium]NBR15294.1 XRE family transcriptional regulator [Crocinitomicaceae bacterium]NBX79663.1 XRE family transcriptional regulator [Flavobacteriales bacterium]NCA20006.1 XRE family transcriptional regulator [Crocinitomicaceae bacterium]
MLSKEEIPDERILRIAKKIRQLRIDANYTSAESFAYDNNINRVQYWRVENGTNLTLKTLLKLLDIHKISLSDFFREI